MLRTIDAALCTALLFIGSAQAEVKEVRLSKQHGLPYLPMIVIEEQKLIEKHAARLGLGDVATIWSQQAGPAAQLDALLAGQVDFIGPGMPTLATIWDRTVGTAQEVRALSAMQSMPYVLVTRNPNVTTIADFTDADKIALPAVKLTGHALALGMAAAKLWGFEKYDKLELDHHHPGASRRHGGDAVGLRDQLPFRQLAILLLRVGAARHPPRAAFL